MSDIGSKIESSDGNATAIAAFSALQHQQQRRQQLQTKLGSLYHRIHQLHNEQYNIYPPFNNYEQYRIYCTQRLARLRHCTYKMVIPVQNNNNNNNNNITPNTTSTTTTTTVVKSLLLHNSKYVNTIPAVQGVGSNVVTTSAGTTVTSGTNTTMTTTSKPQPRSSSGGGKHMYHSRKVVYENILQLSSSGTEMNTSDETEEINNNNNTNIVPSNMDIYSHENIIWNLFYQSERAWAQACALLLVTPSSTNNNNNINIMHSYKKKLSNHRHVQNRFNKAVHWSQLLYNTVRALLLSSSDVTGSNSNNSSVVGVVVFVQECLAYMKWMEGNAAMEHKDYALAYQSYSHSIRTLYQLHQLYHHHHQSSSSTTSHMDESLLLLLPQSQSQSPPNDKWKWHIENVLRPLVRYCQYEMKGMDIMNGQMSEDHHDDDILQWMDQQEQQQRGGSLSLSTSTTNTTKKILRFRNVDVTFDHQIFSQPITVAYLKLEPLFTTFAVETISTMSDHSSTTIRTTTTTNVDNDESIRLRFMSDLDDLMSLVMKEYKLKFLPVNNNTTISSSSPPSQQPQQPTQQQQVLFITFYSYLKYYKLSIWRRQQEIRIQDTLRLHKSNQNDDTNAILPDMIHLYSTLQQIVVSMNELIPTTMMTTTGNTLTTTTSSVDEDDPYTLEAQAHVVRVRAFRCYYMAQYYEMIASSYNNNESQMITRTLQHQQQSYIAARLLLQQSQLLTKRALEEISACEEDATLLLSSSLIDMYVNELEALNTNIKAMFCRLDATYYLHQSQLGALSSDMMNDGDRNTNTKHMLSSSSVPLHPDRPLWMRYEEENDEEEGKNGGDTTLADVPPLPIPLPCKGIFYDLAVQYIDELINEEVVQPMSDHIRTSLHVASTTATTHDTSTESATTSIGNFFGWFNSKSATR